VDLQFLAPLYAVEGPVASVYLDTTRSVEKAAHQIELRWRALRSQLAEQGAQEATLTAMDAVVGQDVGVAGQHGQAVFAAAGRVLLDHQLPAPPRREIAAWHPLPHAMPLVAQMTDAAPYLLIIADRLGADIRAYGEYGDPVAEHRVNADDFPLRKVATGGWKHLKIQHAAENTWSENAEKVADDVTVLADQLGARILIAAGDVRARELLRRHLPDRLRGLLADVDEGGRAAGSSAQALERRVQTLVAQTAAQETFDVLDIFARERGEHDRAVEGLAATVAALRRAQVQTLVLRDDPSSTARLWAGPDALQLGTDRAEVADLGVDSPYQARADEVLLRALVGSAAGVTIVPGDEPQLADGVGAVLRYADASTPA